jgi:hypothetical protein
LLSYESGPAGEGDGSATDLAIQAHRNPRMKQILSRAAIRRRMGQVSHGKIGI